MITDSVVYIDSQAFNEGQYQAGNKLILSCSNSKTIVVHGVSEQEFLNLQRDPSHEAVLAILRGHAWGWDHPL